jgi:hypothetical protein
MKFKNYINEEEDNTREWKQYERGLKTHDWYYDRSNDYSAYNKGKNENDNLWYLFHILAREDKKKAYDMWNKYAKKDFKISKRFYDDYKVK